MIAHHLIRLYPQEQEITEENLSNLRKDIFVIKSNYDIKFLDKYDLRRCSLSDKFICLTQNLGYLSKDEYETRRLLKIIKENLELLYSVFE